jgi:dTDP-4-amino-4,6-dideoxygalactose transaminase
MIHTVPLLDLKRQHEPLEGALTAAFQRILRSGHYILGPEHDAFEAELATFTEASFALAINSGTDAILLALMTLGIGPGDEVLCPTYTFFATAGCIVRLGATPVFVDACPQSFNLDIEDAARKITSKTKAIIPVHLFGQAADMEGVMALAKAHSLYVIEDAAQSLGARYKGQSVGTFGDFGTFSFFPTKNLGCLGDGGALICQNESLAKKAKLLRNHGAEPKYFHQCVGGNFRLDALQTAFLRIKLGQYPQYVADRVRNAEYYTQHLSQSPLIRVNSDKAFAENPDTQAVKILLPYVFESCTPIWNQYTLRVLGAGQRDRLKLFLQDRKIGCETYYPCTMDRQACFQGIGKGQETIRVAHQLQSESLSIPIFGELTVEELNYVIQAVMDFVTLP